MILMRYFRLFRRSDKIDCCKQAESLDDAINNLSHTFKPDKSFVMYLPKDRLIADGNCIPLDGSRARTDIRAIGKGIEEKAR